MNAAFRRWSGVKEFEELRDLCSRYHQAHIFLARFGSCPFSPESSFAKMGEKPKEHRGRTVDNSKAWNRNPNEAPGSKPEAPHPAFRYEIFGLRSSKFQRTSPPPKSFASQTLLVGHFS